MQVEELGPLEAFVFGAVQGVGVRPYERTSIGRLRIGKPVPSMKYILPAWTRSLPQCR